MRGVRDHHYRDYVSYIEFNRRVNPPGQQYFCPDGGSYFEKGNRSNIKCFVDFDARGFKDVSPRDPEELKLAIDGKRLINFHIKLWAEGLMNGHIIAHELMYELLILPDWVCTSLINQLNKEIK